MSSNLPQILQPAQDGLSTFARICIDADHKQGKLARYTDGMTLKDAVIITGLPSEEAARRIREMQKQNEPKFYALRHLCEGASKEYTPAPKPAEVIQMTFWGDENRAAPNAVFRSSLFPALRGRDKENRRYLENEEIFCPAGLKIIFTGKQFDQSDLDVYLELLNMAKPFPLGTPIRFSAYALLKALGLPMGGSNHARLHAVLIRLRGGTPEIIDHGRRYFGGLIEGGFRDEITLEYEITINPKFAIFFGSGMFSTLDLETRRALGRNPTAKALHAYFSTHINPTAHNIETLCNIAGICGKNKKATIIKALDIMKRVGFMDYQLQGNAVLPLNINHTPSQARAIVKAAKKPRSSTRRRHAPTLAGDLLAGLLPPKK